MKLDDCKIKDAYPFQWSDTQIFTVTATCRAANPALTKVDVDDEATCENAKQCFTVPYDFDAVNYPILTTTYPSACNYDLENCIFTGQPSDLSVNLLQGAINVYSS